MFRIDICKFKRNESKFCIYFSSQSQTLLYTWICAYELWRMVLKPSLKKAKHMQYDKSKSIIVNTWHGSDSNAPQYILFRWCIQNLWRLKVLSTNDPKPTRQLDVEVVDILVINVHLLSNIFYCWLFLWGYGYSTIHLMYSWHCFLQGLRIYLWCN